MERTEEKIVLPMAVTFDCGTCTLRAAAAGDGGQRLPKVKILAYSGGPMRVSGYWDNVIIDLAGARFASHTTPLILDHDTGQRIGHTESQVIDGGKITASGVISAGSQAAADLVADAKNGFPFQASVGADIAELQRVREKESVVVNGKTYTGPLNVVRKCMIREISLTVLGADSKTSVSIAAARKKGTRNMDESELEAGGGVATVDAEVERVETVNAICASEHWTDERQAAEVATLRAQAIAGELRIKDLVAKVEKHRKLKALRAGRTKMPDLPGTHHVGIHSARSVSDGGGDFAVLECAIGRHVGLQNLDRHYGPQAAEQSRHAGITSAFDFLKVMASHARGGYISSASKDEVVKAAFSTLDTANILSNVANKLAADVFQSFPSVAKIIARRMSANDFKTHTGVRMTGDSTFREVGAAGEIHHGQLGDQTFTYSVSTYARMFGLTRKDVINDDLDLFSGTPKLLARGAALALEELFWLLVLGNASSFFSSDHGNLLEAGSDLSGNSLALAVQAFLEQQDSDGKPIAAVPRFLVVPPALKTLADEIYASRTVNVGGGDGTESARVPTVNAHFGKYEPIACPWIGAKGLTGGSDASWYLFAEPGGIASHGIAFLNGQESPIIETVDQPADVLGIGWRGYLDFGVCEVDHQAALKATGAPSEE